MRIWTYNLDRQVFAALLRSLDTPVVMAQPEGIRRFAQPNDKTVLYHWSDEIRGLMQELANRGVWVWPQEKIQKYFDRHYATKTMDRLTQYPLERYYFPPGEYTLPGGVNLDTWVIKEGHEHQGKGKHLARPGDTWRSVQPFLIEPFVRGESIRALLIDGKLFGLRYDSESWLKNVDGTVEPFDLPDNIREDATRISAETGLDLLAVDYILGDRPCAIELNVLPGFPDDDEALATTTKYFFRMLA